MRCHLVGAYFGHVSAEDAVVETVKQIQQPKIHPSTGLGTEQQVETKEGKHHDGIAENPEKVARLVDEVEPFVHEPGEKMLVEQHTGKFIFFTSEWCPRLVSAWLS